MLSSISPVGESARGQRWSSTVTAYAVSSLLGGALTGWLTAGLGSLLLGAVGAPARVALLGVVALAGIGADATGRTPSLHRQVDERWLTTYRGWVYGAGFGFQLGVGVMTIMPSSIVLVLWSGTLLAADPSAGLAAGAVFGLGRAMPVVWAGRLRTVAALRRVMAKVERMRAGAARTIPVAQAVLGLTLIGVGVL